MRKALEPVTINLGQQTKVVLHEKRSFRGKGKNKIISVEKVEVPVWRGQTAEFVRYEKSQLRRKYRKDAEQEALKGATATFEVPDDLMEETDA